MSRARVTADPLLKELYEDMAVEFAHNAARERDLDSFKTRLILLSDLIASFDASLQRPRSAMNSSAQFKFECPNCAAKYELIRVEAPPETTADCEITCVSCGGPLRGHQGPFVLKYFLVERPKRRDLISERAKQILREA